MLTQQLDLYPLYNGEKNTVGELQVLADQPRGLGSLLEIWNELTEPSIELTVEVEETSGMDSFVSNVKNILFKKVKG